MGKTLYLECYSGISGDMTVAALLDLGADRGVLDKALYSLPVSGFRTKISRVKKSGLDACDFNVILEHDNHDHDMEYLHGHEHEMEHHYNHEHTHSAQVVGNAGRSATSSHFHTPLILSYNTVVPFAFLHHSPCTRI